MRKTKDSEVRPEPASKHALPAKRATKGVGNAQISQNTNITLPEELLCPIEKDLGNWRDYRLEQDERVFGREPSLRSSVPDVSTENIMTEDPVGFSCLPTNPGTKSQINPSQGKIMLFQGFPLDFREEAVEVRNVTSNSLVSENSRRSSDALNEQIFVYRENNLKTLPEKDGPDHNEIHQINGIFINPMLLFEGKPFIVSSVPNDIDNQIDKNDKGRLTVPLPSIETKHENNLKSSKSLKEFIQPKTRNKPTETITETLKRAYNYMANSEDLTTFLQDHLIVPGEIERPKYREITYDDKEELDFDGHSDFYRQLGQKGEIVTRANRILEEQYLMNPEDVPVSGQLLKKHLSIIFSTGKSMDMSTDSRESEDIKGLKEVTLPLNEEIEKPKECAILKEGSFYHSEHESDILKNEQKKLSFNKDSRPESKLAKLNASTNEEKETFSEVIQTLKLKNKENKEWFDESLAKLNSIYQKEIYKYEAKIKSIEEKNRKYKNNNKSLVEIIKNWEKEMDELATTNKTLHDLVLNLEQELNQVRKNELELREICASQKAKISKLKERGKKDLTELEETRKQIKGKDSKITSMGSFIQNCENLIKTINANLRSLVKDKSSVKPSIDSVFKVLETIENSRNKTSKFIKETSGNNQSPINTNNIDLTFRDKMNVYLTESAVNPLNEILTKSYLVSSPGETHSISARGFQDLRKYDSLPVSNRSVQKSPLKKILSTPHPSQNLKKITNIYNNKSPLSSKEKSPNLPGYYVKKCLTQRLQNSTEKKHHPSLSYRVGDDRGRSTEEDENLPTSKSKSRERSAPETKNRGLPKDFKRGSQ